MNGNISGLTVERSPEKAGVGGSSPSLATMFSITYEHPDTPFYSNSFQNIPIGAGRFASERGRGLSKPRPFLPPA